MAVKPDSASLSISQNAAEGTRTARVTCSLDCPDSCQVLVSIENGRATRVAGDPSHPVTRGFLCGKVARYLDRVYAPNRVLYPLRRKPGAAKQQLAHGREHESFERISWDEALDTIASRLEQIAREHGPESILPYSYAGTVGQLGYGSMDRRFFHRLGASQLDRTICATAGSAALNSVYGTRLGPEPQSFVHARLIVAWGANIHGNNVHLWPFIEAARRNGAKLVVIDPYTTRTAALADQHIALRQGTDTALAMGMMHVILREGLEDRAYIDACTHGFAELRERVLHPEYAPAHVAEITGIHADTIVALAREYATTHPAVIRLNYGIQRIENGGTAARTVAMLPLLTGAWKYHGGGVVLSTSGAYGFNSKALQMPELMQASPLSREARTVNMSQLGHALTEIGCDGAEPGVHALFVYNSNPAAVAPNQNAVLRGLQRADLFTVVHDVTFTDTADYADLLLPAPTWLEQDDVQGAYGHYFVQHSPRAIEPMGESRSNVWLFAELAQRMGFREPCFRDTEEDLMRQALTTEHPWHKGISLESLAENGRAELRLPRNDRGEFLPFADASWFRTPSGRGEFYSEVLAAQALDPLPAYVPPAEFAAEQPGRTLRMLPRKADNWMNSTFADLPRHRSMEAARAGVLEMAAVDAASRGLRDGDLAEITSERGSLRLLVRFSTRVQAGTVSATLGVNKLMPEGRGVNVLTSERLTDMGGGATFYGTMVQVSRVVAGESPRNAEHSLAMA